MRDHDRPAEPAADHSDAVGIVVQSGYPAEPRPRVAFVWGGEGVAAPSLPFGRWKVAVRAA